jgi:Peptidase family M28
MRGAVLATIVVLICGFASAQKLHFSPVDKTDIVERMNQRPGSDAQRADQLRNWFATAGCNGSYLSEQRTGATDAPNVICRLHGESDDTVVIGAHYDHASSAQRPIDNWSGAALLPSIYQCLRSRRRHHTLIFVAFADRGAETSGAEFFAAHLTPAELSHVIAMINLDPLGFSPTKVWTAHSDKSLVQALVNMVYVMKLPASQIDIAAAGPTDSQPFASRNIPQITIHSLTQANLTNGTPTAFRPGNYYDSYRLLCGYLAYLDETHKTRRHGE